MTTVAAIMEQISAAKRLVDSVPAAPDVRIHTTKGGFQAPVRRHSKSRNGGKASYHARVQKKWTRRFGTQWVEVQPRGEVYVLNTGALFGAPGPRVLMVREDDLPEFRRLVATASEVNGP